MPNSGMPGHDQHAPGDQPPVTTPAHAAPEPSAEPPAARPPKSLGSGKGRLPRVIGSLVVVAVIITGYVSLLMYFQSEANARSSAVEVGDTSGERGIDVSAWLVSVDQQQEQAVLRVNFEPKGDIVDEDGTLAVPVRLFVSSANAAQDRTFDKGKIMNPTDVTVDLYDSSITRYPFDRFKADLWMSASAEIPKAEPAKPANDTDESEDGEAAPAEGQPAAPVAASETVLVPIAIDFYGALHGLKVETGEVSAEDGITEVGFQVSRSATTLAMAWFVMIVLLAVGVTVLVITLAIVFGCRKLELPIIGLLGTLLFGFVAFRNTLPGTPPIGSLSDYIAFFWAEGLVAVCLFTLVATYLKRTIRPVAAS